MKQPTVREINRHVIYGSGACYVTQPGGRRFRISCARKRQGVLEERVISGSDKEWEAISPTATIELL